MLFRKPLALSGPGAQNKSLPGPSTHMSPVQMESAEDCSSIQPQSHRVIMLRTWPARVRPESGRPADQYPESQRNPWSTALSLSSRQHTSQVTESRHSSNILTPESLLRTMPESTQNPRHHWAREYLSHPVPAVDQTTRQRSGHIFPASGRLSAHETGSRTGPEPAKSPVNTGRNQHPGGYFRQWI